MCLKDCSEKENTTIQNNISLKISNERTEKMEEKNEINAAAVAEEAVKAERKRVETIHNVCKGEFAEIEAKAVAEGWNKEQTCEAVLAEMRNKRPSVTSTPIVAKKNEFNEESLTCAVALRAGIDKETLVKEYGEETVEFGYKNMDISMRDVVRESLKLNHLDAPRSIGNGEIRAAFSTVSLPGILSNVANKSLLKAYNSIVRTAPKLCSKGNLVDFKTNYRYRLVDAGNLEQLSPNGEIPNGTLKEEGATNQLKTYGKMLKITREMIINDDLSAFTQIPTAFGAKAGKLVDQLFYERLISNPTQGDGNALFSSAHRNYLSGSTYALSADALKKGIELFMKQKDADGQPIAVEPRYLLVPPALKFKAIELLSSVSVVATGSTDKVIPSYNSLSASGIEVVCSPYLTSETGWYLFGSPSEVDTFEIGYLNGRETPIVEQGEVDFNQLGLQFRVYFDIGIKEQDFRGIVYAAGAN